MARRKRETRQLGLVMNRAVNGGEDFDSLIDEMFPGPAREEDEPQLAEKWWDD